LALATDAIQAATDIVDTQKNELVEIVNEANTIKGVRTLYSVQPVHINQ